MKNLTKLIGDLIGRINAAISKDSKFIPKELLEYVVTFNKDIKSENYEHLILTLHKLYNRRGWFTGELTPLTSKDIELINTANKLGGSYYKLVADFITFLADDYTVIRNNLECVDIDGYIRPMCYFSRIQYGTKLHLLVPGIKTIRDKLIIKPVVMIVE